MKALQPLAAALVAAFLAACGGTESAPAQPPPGGGSLFTGSLAAARSSHTATLLLDGKVLVAGGAGEPSGQLASAELYDPAAGTFAPTGSMVVARVDHTATRLPDGRVLIVGGYGASGELSSAELYDPATRAFRATGRLATARFRHAATLLPAGTVLVTGGTSSCNGDACNEVDTAEVYDPVSESFTATGGPITGRYSHAAVLLKDGRVLVVGGMGRCRIHCESLDTAELYDPATASFAATGTMTCPRTDLTATLLESGFVLIAGSGPSVGGFLLSQPQGSAELYDPARETFVATGNLRQYLYTPTTTLLQDGGAMVVGQNGIELFDPGSGSFTARGRPIVGAYRHTATLLDSGKVLVAGGYSLEPFFKNLSAAALYLP